MRLFGGLFFAAIIAGAAQAQIPFLGKPFGVSITSNIDYGDGTVDFSTSPSVADLYLDLYEPNGPSVPALKPGLVLAHGGAWLVGAKDSSTGESSPGSGDFNTPMHEYAAEFAKRGYVCVSIDYRKILDDPEGTGLLSTGGADISDIVTLVQALISGSVTVPDDQVRRTIEAAVADTKNAVDWMVANAATYGIDPNRIAVGGYSAGAFNAVWATYAANAPVAAAFSNSGGITAGTASFVNSASQPPIVFFHGDADAINAVTASRGLDTLLESAGIAHQYFEIPGENHFYLRTLPITDPPTKLIPGATLEDNLAIFMYNHLDLAPLATAALPTSSRTPRTGLWLALASLGALVATDRALARNAE